MSNMAAHRQYSGKKLSPMSENPFSFAKESSDNEISKNAAHLEHGLYAMQEHAKKLGCTSQNYSLFFIRHIFCDNLLRQIELSQNGLFYDDFSYNKIRHYDVDTFTNKQNEAKLAISEN